MFGNFATIQGFYNWLRSASSDDTYRTAIQRSLEHHAKNNRDDLNAYVVNFRYLIVDAIWQKIKAYPGMLSAFRESVLPFEMYYSTFIDRNDRSAGTIRSRPSIAEWIIPAMSVLREAAKENVEPDLDYLIVDSEELEEFYAKWRAQMATIASNKPTTVHARNHQRPRKQRAGQIEMPDFDVQEGSQDSVEKETELPVADAVLEGLPVDEPETQAPEPEAHVQNTEGSAEAAA